MRLNRVERHNLGSGINLVPFGSNYIAGSAIPAIQPTSCPKGLAIDNCAMLLRTRFSRGTASSWTFEMTHSLPHSFPESSSLSPGVGRLMLLAHLSGLTTFDFLLFRDSRMHHISRARHTCAL